MKVGGRSGRRSAPCWRIVCSCSFDNMAVIVCGDISNLVTQIDEFQTHNKVQFVRQTITKDFGSDGTVLFEFCITFYTV